MRNTSTIRFVWSLFLIIAFSGSLFAVSISGDFTYSGDYDNNDGLIIESDGRMEILGNLFGTEDITIEEGGELIVYGNVTNSGKIHVKALGRLVVYGDLSGSKEIRVEGDAYLIVQGDLFGAESCNVKVKGNIIVLGSYDSKVTNIEKDNDNKPNANLVVGGDFFGGQNVSSEWNNLYILNSSATIEPEKLKTDHYSDSTEFFTNESFLVEIFIEISISQCWVGGQDSDWFNSQNWTRNTVPGEDAEIEIKPNSLNFPVISGAVEVHVCNLTLDLNATLTLDPGVSFNVSGFLVNNGEIILKSTPDLVAALNVPQDNTHSGQGKIELSLKANQWYRLGQPIQNPTAAIFDAGDQEDSWIYVSENSWKRITSDDTPLETMEGTMALYKSDHTLSYSGTLNTGEISWDIPFGKGYYLMANPYPGTMKWNLSGSSSGISLTNVSPTIYYRIYAGSQVGDYLITYNGTTGESTIVEGLVLPGGYNAGNMGNIPSLQSVWVNVVSSEPANITLDNRARISDTSMPLKSAGLGKSSRDLIRISQGNQYISDGAVLYFDDDFSEGLDESDSEKMFNNSDKVPEIYTRAENISLCINGLPGLADAEVNIPLSVRNQVESPVTLSLDLTAFNERYAVFLEDTKTQILTNMRATPDYVYTPAELGDTRDRFVLHLQKITTAIADPANFYEQDSDNITITGFGSYARVNISSALLQQKQGEARIEVLDLSGRLVNQVTTSQSVAQVDLPLNSGLYVIRVKVGDFGKSEKIMVQNP